MVYFHYCFDSLWTDSDSDPWYGADGQTVNRLRRWRGLVLLFLPAVLYRTSISFSVRTYVRENRSVKVWTSWVQGSMLEFQVRRTCTCLKTTWHLDDVVRKQNGALPSKNNEVEIYTSGYEFFPALFRHPSRQHHTYIFDIHFTMIPPACWYPDALIDKAREGSGNKGDIRWWGIWSVKNRLSNGCAKKG